MSSWLDEASAESAAAISVVNVSLEHAIATLADNREEARNALFKIDHFKSALPEGAQHEVDHFRSELTDMIGRRENKT